MAVVKITEPSAAVLQAHIYNSNVGGGINVREEFDVPPGTPYAVVGFLLSPAATPASVESVLKPAVTAIANVVSVNGNQVFGKAPATAETPDTEWRLHVASRLTESLGSGDVFVRKVESNESSPVPVDTNFAVLIMRLTAELDDAAITTLEAALEAIGGVTLAEHLIDGASSPRAAGPAKLTVNVHLRLDAIEVEV